MATKPMASETLIISRTGQARGLVGPLVDKITKQMGPLREIRRASLVEPTAELSASAVGYLAKWLPFDLADPATGTPLYTVEELRSRLPQAAWWADLTMQQEVTVLGPFETRELALAAEKEWLLARHIPTITTPPGT